MKALTELHSKIVEIYGYGVQVSMALVYWRTWLNERISSGSTTLDNRVLFGKRDPNDPNATYVYRRTFRYLLDASSPNGDTLAIHRRNLIALLYACWENPYRRKITEEAGLKGKYDIKSDVFQDVRIYRNSILHANGTLDQVPKIFRFFSKGDKVTLTSQDIDEIFRAAIDELNRIAKKYFDTNPRFILEEPLHPAGQPVSGTDPGRSER